MQNQHEHYDAAAKSTCCFCIPLRTGVQILSSLMLLLGVMGLVALAIPSPGGALSVLLVGGVAGMLSVSKRSAGWAKTFLAVQVFWLLAMLSLLIFFAVGYDKSRKYADEECEANDDGGDENPGCIVGSLSTGLAFLGILISVAASLVQFFLVHVGVKWVREIERVGASELQIV